MNHARARASVHTITPTHKQTSDDNGHEAGEGHTPRAREEVGISVSAGISSRDSIARPSERCTRRRPSPPIARTHEHGLTACRRCRNNIHDHHPHDEEISTALQMQSNPQHSLTTHTHTHMHVLRAGAYISFLILSRERLSGKTSFLASFLLRSSHYADGSGQPSGEKKVHRYSTRTRRNRLKEQYDHRSFLLILLLPPRLLLLRSFL